MNEPTNKQTQTDRQTNEHIKAAENPTHPIVGVGTCDYCQRAGRTHVWTDIGDFSCKAPIYTQKCNVKPKLSDSERNISCQ